MMEQTRVFTALEGVRGRPPVDLAALEQLLVRFSYLVIEQRWIKEIDINPLLASRRTGCSPWMRGWYCIDRTSARMSLPKLAIRPYPSSMHNPGRCSDGTPVTLRPIRPEDEPLMVKFHETLSDRSVYFRWLHMLGPEPDGSPTRS